MVSESKTDSTRNVHKSHPSRLHNGYSSFSRLLVVNSSTYTVLRKYPSFEISCVERTNVSLNRFYVQMGLGAMSFTYTVISAACGLVAVLCGLYLYAHLGRRPILVTGAFLQIPFMCLVAGLGGKKNHSTADIHMVIASIILFSCFEKISLSTSCYIITSEIGGTRMRKKSGRTV